MQQQLQALRGGGTGAAPAVSSNPYFHPPAFQNHMEQLGKLTRLFSPYFFCHVIELWRPRFIP